MKSPSSRTVGASSTAASKRSFSSQRVTRPAWPAWARGSAVTRPAAPSDPPAMGFFASLSVEPPRSGFVDLLELDLRPLDGVLGFHALDALGVHIQDDVLRDGLGGLARGRPRIAEHPRLARRLTEDLEGLVDPAPHRVLFPHLRCPDGVALVDLEPLPVVLLLVHPPEEILGELLVLRILHDRVLEGAVEGELPGRSLREQRLVLDVLVEGLALVVLQLVLLPLGHDVDRCAIECGADLACMEGAVVVGVVPGEPAFIAGVLPECLHELHRFDRALAVDHDLLAACVHLGAAEVPEQRIGEGRRVAEAVAQGLADRLALGLELLAPFPPLVPRLRELLDPHLAVPGPAPRHSLPPPPPPPPHPPPPPP